MFRVSIFVLILMQYSFVLHAEDDDLKPRSLSHEEKLATQILLIKLKDLKQQYKSDNPASMKYPLDSNYPPLRSLDSLDLLELDMEVLKLTSENKGGRFKSYKDFKYESFAWDFLENVNSRFLGNPVPTLEALMLKYIAFVSEDKKVFKLAYSEFISEDKLTFYYNYCSGKRLSAVLSPGGLFYEDKEFLLPKCVSIAEKFVDKKLEKVILAKARNKESNPNDVSVNQKNEKQLDKMNQYPGKANPQSLDLPK